MLTTGVYQRLNVFGEATSAVAATCVEKLVADAHVRANAFAYHIDIGADQLAEVGNVVHKRDASCEHGVSGIFSHLGGCNVHKNYAEIVEQERTIESLHDATSAFALDTDDNAVGRHKVFDGSAFFEKFRVRSHLERHIDAAAVELFADCCFDFNRSSYRHGTLGDKNGVFVDVSAKRASHFEHILEVGASVFVGRSSNGTKHHFHAVDNAFERCREVESVGFYVARNQFVKSRLVDGYNAFFEVLYFVTVDVDASYFRSHFGETCT